MAGVIERSSAVFDRGPGAERIAYFSDAVYAIALTLLVVDLKIPDGATSAADVMAQEWPSYLGFALSFVIISISWIGHHRRFRVIVRHDVGLIVINLVLLFGIASVPFPTALLAEFSPQPVAVALNCLTTQWSAPPARPRLQLAQWHCRSACTCAPPPAPSRRILGRLAHGGLRTRYASTAKRCWSFACPSPFRR